MKGEELQKLTKKPRIEEKIASLEGEDKGWFEDECRAVLFNPAAAPKAPAKKKASSSGGGGGGAGGAGNGQFQWLSTAAKGGNKSATATKKAAPSNPFAMLGDE